MIVTAVKVEKVSTPFAGNVALRRQMSLDTYQALARSQPPSRGTSRCDLKELRELIDATFVSTPFAGNVALRPTTRQRLSTASICLNPLRGERRAATKRCRK